MALSQRAVSEDPRTRTASTRMASSTEAVAEEKTCRLCFGDDDGPLVQPCACRGSATWIHEHCLEHWRRTGPKEDAAYRCGECMDEYRDALSIELLSARLQTKRTSGQITISTLDALASELQAQGKYDEAEPLFREALEWSRAALGSRHRSTLLSINNLGLLLHTKGDNAAAELLYCKALEVQRETLGNQHPHTLNSINNLGALLKAKGDFAAADPLLCEALEGLRETRGNRHASTLACINNLGLLLEAKGDLTAAELLLRETLEVKRKTLGNRHPETLTSMNNLGALLYAKGDLAAAEPLLREALEGQRIAKTLGSQHPSTLLSINNLTELLIKQVKAKATAALRCIGFAAALALAIGIYWARSTSSAASAGS